MSPLGPTSPEDRSPPPGPQGSRAGVHPLPPLTGEVSPPPPGEPWTPILLTRWSGEYLRGRGVENGRLDAELLLAHVLGVKRLDLYLQFDRPLQAPELGAFKTLLKRRAAREPLQYVLGRTAFRELDLRTDSRALIPRPETEILVGEVLAWTEGKTGGGPAVDGRDESPGAWGGPLWALDVGTGTGAIALSLLKEGPFHRVVGTDPSPGALELARENARETGLDEGLELREGALFAPLEEGERFHVIVSNPPYVAEGDRAGLQPEILHWEPSRALFAGADGLEVLDPLVRRAPAHLAPGGLLALEVGEGQASRVASLMETTGAYEEVLLRPDLTGRLRVVLGVASRGELADL